LGLTGILKTHRGRRQGKRKIMSVMNVPLALFENRRFVKKRRLTRRKGGEEGVERKSGKDSCTGAKK